MSLASPRRPLRTASVDISSAPATGAPANSSRPTTCLNRIYRLVTWTYECLTLNGYVVDCPTRERLGYGGDAGTSLETGLCNFDTGGLYNRWAANWRDAQDPEIRRPAVHRSQLPGQWAAAARCGAASWSPCPGRFI